MAQKTYLEIINGFSSRTVGVIGDMMLDTYVFSKPVRLSREAPVVVVEFEHEVVRPGGAANAASNFRSLGANVEAVGVVGDDAHGEQLRKILSGDGIRTGGILVSKKHKTTTKTRVLAGDIHTAKQQVLRIDRGKPSESDNDIVRPALEFISRVSPDVNCWLVSDYGYGFVTGEIENCLADLSNRAPVIADSRYNVKEFSRITAVTPNESEALSFGKYYLKDETNLKVIGQQMLEILFSKYALITRGNEGMIIFEKGKEPVDIPVVGSTDIVDVSGAGDTVAAVFGLALACGGTAEQAARLANCAASVVVMKSGTATCSREELIAAVEQVL